MARPGGQADAAATRFGQTEGSAMLWPRWGGGTSKSKGGSMETSECLRSLVPRHVVGFGCVVGCSPAELPKTADVMKRWPWNCQSSPGRSGEITKL